jgi:hypothetical protein
VTEHPLSTIVWRARRRIAAWFRFVYPNMSILQKVGPKGAFVARIKPELDTYYGSAFERLSREALPHIYEREGVTASYEVGDYRDKNTQIDVVGVRDDGWIDLGECKWGPVRSVVALFDELDTKVKHFPNPRRASIGRVLFTQSDRRQVPSGRLNARWYGLTDLYETSRSRP